jgi:hypothetical protein
MSSSISVGNFEIGELQPARPGVTRGLVVRVHRLAALRAKDTDPKARIAAWKKARDQIAKRQPAWQTLERMGTTHW